MLTGDTVATAVNIGIATSLIRPTTLQLRYQWDELDSTAIDTTAERIEDGHRRQDIICSAAEATSTAPPSHTRCFSAVEPGSLPMFSSTSSKQAAFYYKYVSFQKALFSFSSAQLYGV